MSKGGRRAVLGAVALGAAGVLSKLIGMAYRIPLANIIGADGMGTFQIVFPLYTLLVTISTAGLPVAISVVVARLVSERNTAAFRGLLRSLLCAVGLAGLLGAALLFVLADPLASAMGDSLAAPGFRGMAPAVLFIFLIAVYRGFLQGTGYLVTTAVVQLVEQVARVLISLPCAVWGMRQGPAMAAAYALIGTSVAEAITLLYALGAYRRRAVKLPACDGAFANGATSHASQLRVILMSAGPIVGAAIMVPAMNLLDSFTCVRLLQAGGVAERLAVTQYGLYSGAVLTLLNVMGALALAVATTLAPQVSVSHARGDKGTSARLATLSLRVSMLIGLPAVSGLFLMARPLMAMFYPSYTGPEIDLAGQLLRIAAFQVLFFFTAQCAGAVLQGLGRAWYPFFALLLGMALKVALAAVWIPGGEPGVLGAPLSSLVGYAVIAMTLVLLMRRQTGCKLPFWHTLGKPILATAGMVLVVGILRAVWPMPGTLVTLCIVGAGALVYGILVLLLGTLEEEELHALPGGGALIKILRKLRVLRRKEVGN